VCTHTLFVVKASSLKSAALPSKQTESKKLLMGINPFALTSGPLESFEYMLIKISSASKFFRQKGYRAPGKFKDQI